MFFKEFLDFSDGSLSFKAAVGMTDEYRGDGQLNPGKGQESPEDTYLWKRSFNHCFNPPIGMVEHRR